MEAVHKVEERSNVKELKSKKKKIKLSVKNINHTFKSQNGDMTKALSNVSLNIEEQGFVALVGPSGCGKSTLLNIMSGLIKPNQGQVLLDDIPVKGVNDRIGYMSQADTLLPWRNVIDNVALGLEIKDVSKEERYEIAQRLIDRVGLSGFENSYPFELSGGMRKRVTLIRTLAVDPEILFMDEPFGPLDCFTKEMLQEDILKLWQENKKTVVYVTHDLSEAITLADRVVIMTARPSIIKSDYDIPLTRPRSVMDIRFNSKFIELEKMIWNDLKEEVKREG
ncbi:NitT/TauT family transport system ATP-binding protein [Natronincola peptidivorans]|uniref:NitT/TauT family transport system ATP-binding protein n=1 Tax=Natronincola peptidivorans TaxID=426128 RepID=A0A1I0FN51_9FIRM|nr:NitT/TauT family transport system ATP-binding protein [Natronincola peptidivorans]